METTRQELLAVAEAANHSGAGLPATWAPRTPEYSATPGPIDWIAGAAVVTTALYFVAGGIAIALGM